MARRLGATGTIALLLLFSSSSFAAPKWTVLSSFAVQAQSFSELRALVSGYDVEQRSGMRVEVIVPANQDKDFQQKFPQAKLIEKDIHDVFTRKDRTNPGWHDAYHTYDTVVSELNQTVQQYPTMASLENYGSSQEGRQLLALKITNKTGSVGKPEVLITSSTHGNEIATPELTLTMIQQLLSGYGTDARMTAMLDNHIIYVIPVVCPDGYINQDRYTNGLDPNRDYPYPDQPNHTSNVSVSSEMSWFATKHIVGSLDIHSNAQMVMYPWAYTDESIPAADLPKFEKISNILAQDTGFQAGQISQILYIAVGSSADYWYWQHGTLALGFEMGGEDFAPDPSELPQLINETLPALYHFIENF